MEHGTKTVIEGTKTIDSNILLIDSIVQASDNAANMFNDIIEIAKLQATSMENVKASVEEISLVAKKSNGATVDAAAEVQEQAVSISMLADIAKELAELSGELRDEIALFKQKE